MGDDEIDRDRGAAPDFSPAASLLTAADPAKANAYLEEHTALIRLQIEDMKRESAIRWQSLRIRHAIDALKLALEGVAALLVVAAGVALAVAVWSAARSDGLVVEAFSVPPDLANKGLTGEVIAAKVLDRLAALQAQTVSNRAATSYANNWGDDIKVQIPQTGVSFGELNRTLREWLGHETHIAGEIYRTGPGLAIAARTGGKVSPVFTGPDADLDKLIGQAAEAVYRETQPYRYAVYLHQRNRVAEARAIYQQLILTGAAMERPWAYAGLSLQASSDGRFEESIALVNKAIALKPDMLLAYENLAAGFNTLDRDEQALAAISKAVALASHGRDPQMSEDFFTVNRLQDRTTRDLLLGDYQSVLALDRQLLAAPDRVTWDGARQNDLDSCGSLHDARCVSEHWKAIPPIADPLQRLGHEVALQIARAKLGDWQAALALEPGLMKALSGAGELGRFYIRHIENPFVALTHAGLGDFAAANRLIADTPLDCVRCIRFRGRIAAMQGDWRAADNWFRRAAALAPSIPSVYTDWGEALLRRGDTGGAIAKFQMAHAKGPNFADPLEIWGEALMHQNRSDLAIVKFAEAARHAPNWGRLHLNWGEALFYAGRKDEAKKQFSTASRLHLSTAEKGELEQWLRSR